MPEGSPAASRPAPAAAPAATPAATPAEARKPRLVLVDGSGYIFRAFFALPPLTDPKGTPVGAVFGFCNMLFRLAQDMPGDQLVVVFDKGAQSFRNDMYDQYKANRLEPPDDLVPQFPLVREAAHAFHLPVIELEGYEADDVIATYARHAREQGREVIIVSSDKDLMQLVGGAIQMYDPMKQRPIDRAEVIARFGVGPEQVGDVLALAGDTSDNVPGVPGIGVKTAAQLLTEFGSLEDLLAGADTIKQPKRRQNLLDHAEQARLSRRLVALCDTAPVPATLDQLDGAIDYARLLAFAREHNFKSLVQRLEPLAETRAEAVLTAEAPAPAASYATIGDLAGLDEWIARARAAGALALSLQTSSPSIMRADVVGIGLAVNEGEAAYLPLGHKDDFGTRAAGQPDREEALARLRPVLEDPGILKVGHDLKQAVSVLARLGITLAPYDDTMLLSYVLDGAAHGHGLAELASLHLDRQTAAYEAVCGSGRSRIAFDRAPIARATPYAAECAEVLLRLHRLLKLAVARERRTRVYETLERPLLAVLAAMEQRGIRVDRQVLQDLSADFFARMAELEEQAYRLAGRTFNLGSPKQLSEVLFQEQGLAASRKTKTGSHTTGANVLEALAAEGHPLPSTILAWRQLQKLTGTYTDALIGEIDPSDGRVHTTYAMAATSTGRLSSNEPNLQNIPIRTEEGRKIRRAFVAEDGHQLMSADYSQIELRVLAHMAGIEALKEAFAKDVDVHAVTASQMFGVPIEGMDPLLRRNAKMINYGIIYGIGAFGLAQRLGIEYEVARHYIEAYFEQYPGIRDYMERAKQEARTHGYVTTLFGRLCATPEIKSGNPSRRGYAERAAINAPIQGSAADVMRRAMIRAERALERSNLGARMLLQVHDELVFEVPQDEIEPTAELITEVMSNAAHLEVPLVVDIGHGANWDAAH
jgi:DNA polymerase-1